jgi:hypothetical protein
VFTCSSFVLLFSIHHEPTDKLTCCCGKKPDAYDEQNSGEIELKFLGSYRLGCLHGSLDDGNKFIFISSIYN